MPLILGAQILSGYCFLNYKKVTSFQVTSISSISFYSLISAGYDIFSTGVIKTGYIYALILAIMGLYLIVFGDTKKDIEVFEKDLKLDDDLSS